MSDTNLFAAIARVMAHSALPEALALVAAHDADIAELDAQQESYLRGYYSKLKIRDLCLMESENPDWTAESDPVFFEVLAERMARR